MLRKQNNKSDFTFIIRLCLLNNPDAGYEYSVNDILNWEMILYTSSKAVSYKASRAFGVFHNCNQGAEGEDFFNIYVDNPRFPLGALKADLFVEFPDQYYPDGIRRICVPDIETGIEIVSEAGLVSNVQLPIYIPV